MRALAAVAYLFVFVEFTLDSKPQARTYDTLVLVQLDIFPFKRGELPVGPALSFAECAGLAVFLLLLDADTVFFVNRLPPVNCIYSTIHN